MADPGLSFISHMSQGDIDSPFGGPVPGLRQAQRLAGAWHI